MAEKDLKEKKPQPNENSAGPDINADENMSGTSHLNNPLDECNVELEKVKSELDEYKDKYLRLQAEFDNFRRRTAKERLELVQTAGKDVIVDLLDVMDDSDRAQKQMEATDDIKQLREGVTLVFNKLRNVLQAKGLKPMETKETDFNPDLHEAITEVPAPSEKLKGKVIDEVGKGYYLKDKIIRHAKVVVGK
jgi:molecular chaperone GrpE